MDKNLQAYVKLYNNRIPLDLRNLVLEELKSLEWHQHLFYNSKKNKFHDLVGDSELDVTYLKSKDLDKNIMDITWKVIDDYIKDLNFPWFSGWDGYSQVRFNRYLPDKEMALHWDGISSLFDGERKGIPKLSLVAALDENYEGGNFVMFEDMQICIPAGGYLVFPSTFMFPHKVTPVTKGERNTFVSWVW